jgi:hypothetical protein
VHIFRLGPDYLWRLDWLGRRFDEDGSGLRLWDHGALRWKRNDSSGLTSFINGNTVSMCMPRTTAGRDVVFVFFLLNTDKTHVG